MGKLLTIKEAAEKCGCTPTTLRTKIKNQEIVAIKWSKTDYKIDSDELERFLKERSTA